MKEMKKFLPEFQIHQRIKENRGKIVGEIFANLQDILQLLKKKKDIRPGNYRMADFGHIINVMTNNEEYAEKIMKKIAEFSLHLTMEDDFIFRKIMDYFSYSSVALEGTAGQIYEQLNLQNDYVQHRKSAHYLGFWLKNNFNELGNYFRVEREYDRSGKQYKYKIEEKISNEEDVIEKKQEQNVPTQLPLQGWEKM